MDFDAKQNYFEIFGLPVDFNLDTDLLTERYRELQKAVHPDKFANASDRDRRLAVQQAAFINEALQTLKLPLKRARYILLLNGVEFDDENETTQDPAFLMEQMELRESLSEVRQKEDPFAALDDLLQTIKNKQESMTANIIELLENQDFAPAKAIVQKLQFLEKLRLEGENLEQDIADAI